MPRCYDACSRCVLSFYDYYTWNKCLLFVKHTCLLLLLFNGDEILFVEELIKNFGLKISDFF